MNTTENPRSSLTPVVFTLMNISYYGPWVLSPSVPGLDEKGNDERSRFSNGLEMTPLTPVPIKSKTVKKNLQYKETERIVSTVLNGNTS